MAEEIKHPRALGRIKNLMGAAQKMKMRLEKSPKHPHAPRWQKAMEQYMDSLENFKKYGQEKPPTGNPVGVDINVPKIGGN